MARKRDPARDQARKLWLESNQQLPLKDIATQLGKKPAQIRKWKSLDDWESGEDKQASKKEHRKGNVTNEQRERSLSYATEQLSENGQLTDKQKMFCMYYLQRFNATWAYMKSYGVNYATASAAGARMLANVKVQKQLSDLKKSIVDDQYLTARDIANEYAKQAFSDVGDYLSFSSEKVLRWHKLHNKRGKFRDDKGRFDYEPTIDPSTGEQAFYVSNSVNFKPSEFMDTSLIKSVKINNGDVDLELYDKQQALGYLSKLLEDSELDRKIKRQQLEKVKADTEISKAKASILSGEDEDSRRAKNDEYLDALRELLGGKNDGIEKAGDVESDSDA